MFLRLLLVGMVGGLGLTLPDGADLQTSLSWARTGATVCAGPRAVTFEPIAALDSAVGRLADELNRMSDGMNLSERPVATAARPTTPMPTDMVARIFNDNNVWAGPTVEVGMDLPQKPEASWFPRATANSTDDVARIFDDNDVWAGPAVEVASALPKKPATQLIPPATATSIDAVAIMFNDNDVWAGPAAEVASAPATIPAPRLTRFEPIAAVELSTIADELNQAAEGLKITSVPTRRPEAEPTVGTAMKLTRDAALAWLNVLAKTTTDSVH